jgi:hypothetical protein
VPPFDPVLLTYVRCFHDSTNEPLRISSKVTAFPIQRLLSSFSSSRNKRRNTSAPMPPCNSLSRPIYQLASRYSTNRLCGQKHNWTHLQVSYHTYIQHSRPRTVIPDRLSVIITHIASPTYLSFRVSNSRRNPSGKKIEDERGNLSSYVFL